jgi:hypothetical protein
LGGNVSFALQHSKSGGSDVTDRTTNYTLSPAIARAVKDGLLLGLNLTYSHYRVKSSNTPATVSYTYGYGLGVFVRKYKMLGAGFALFGEGDLGGQYMHSNAYVETYPKNPDNKSYTLGAGFYPGIAYFVGRHVQVETGIQNLVSVQYQHSKFVPGSSNEAKTDVFNAGTNFNQLFDNFVVGVKYIL